jgi:NB-ARC domain
MGSIPRRRRRGRRPGERADTTDPSYSPRGADDGGDRDGLRAAAENTGAATAADGGIANTGVWIDRSVRQEAPRRPAPWPHLVGNPPGRALGFQERAESFQLRMVLEAEGTAVVGQVLSGLGGVGKTQLAADYARTAFASGRLDVLVWVTVASRQAVIDGYTRAAVELLGVEPDEDSAQRFLAWLQPSAARAACRWLVVLDDLADPADLTGLWPPMCASGRAVVTTRRRGAALTGPGRRRVDVGVFTPAEASAALHQVLAERGHPAQPPEQVEALAAELGFLPLALSQAAAYITNEDIGVQRYRDLLANKLLHEVVPEEGELPDDHQRIISATWELSIDQADAARPAGLARPVLQMASMLDPAGIPQAVLSSPPALDHLATYLPGREHVVDEATVDAALRVLHRYSLIDHDRALIYREVRVHQLVQRATRENLNAQADLGPDLYAALAVTVADALEAVWPEAERDELGQVLRASTAALQQAAGPSLWSQDEGGHGVLFRSATSLGEAGQVTAARDAYTSLYRTALRYLGPDRPGILATRGNLARWRGEAGDPAGAATATEEMLADCLRVLGPDHPHTLVTRGNLARWREQATLD